MRKINLNKKAQSMFDVVIFMVFLMLMVIGFVLFIYVFHLVTVKMQGISMPSNIINFTQVTNQTFVALDNGLGSLKYIAIAIMFGMIMNILVSNFLIKVHPAFWLLYVGIVILAIIISVFMSNAYITIASDPTLAATFTSFTVGDFMMRSLPLIVAVVGLVGGLFLFLGITRDEGAGGGF